MTAVEFDAVKPLLNISDERIAAARQALVDGRTLRAVGEQFGWSRQAVGDAIDVVWKTRQNYREAQRVAANADALLSPGWEQVTLIAPTHLITKFRAEIAQATNENSKKGVKKKARRGETPGKVNVNETKNGPV
jgi:hypothetical protein